MNPRSDSQPTARTRQAARGKWAVVTAILAAVLVLPTALVNSVEPALAADAPRDVRRVEGTTRYWTSCEASKDHLYRPGKPIFLASGLDFPDALAGGPAAARVDGSLVLTDPWYLNSCVVDALNQIKPSEVVILGGTGAISQGVEDYLRQLTDPWRVKRLFGNNRYETAEVINKHYFAGSGARALVASGRDFPDALSAAGVAAGQGAAIVLSPGSDLGWPAVRALQAMGTRQALVVGGWGVLGNWVTQGLRDMGISDFLRVAGTDRYKTASILVDYAGPRYRTGAYIASGQSYYDALAVSAYTKTMPIILTPQQWCLDDAASSALWAKFHHDVRIVGGTGVLPEGLNWLQTCGSNMVLEPDGHFTCGPHGCGMGQHWVWHPGPPACPLYWTPVGEGPGRRCDMPWIVGHRCSATEGGPWFGNCAGRILTGGTIMGVPGRNTYGSW